MVGWILLGWVALSTTAGAMDRCPETVRRFAPVGMLEDRERRAMSVDLEHAWSTLVQRGGTVALVEASDENPALRWATLEKLEALAAAAGAKVLRTEYDAIFGLTRTVVHAAPEALLPLLRQAARAGVTLDVASP